MKRAFLPNFVSSGGTVIGALVVISSLTAAAPAFAARPTPAAPAAPVAPASSDSSSSTPFRFGGSSSRTGSAPVNVEVTLTEVNGKIKFDVKVAPTAATPNIADIRGLFFNLNDDSLLGKLRFEGANVTTVNQSGKVDEVGGANIKGGGGKETFDIGVEIGTNGIGTDDIRETSFLVSHRAGKALSLNQFSFPTASGDEKFAVRLTSVGPEGSNRSDSAKINVTNVLPPVSLNEEQKEEQEDEQEDQQEDEQENQQEDQTSDESDDDVVINPPPSDESVPEEPDTKPVEVPEPGTAAALLLATVGGASVLKRRQAALK